MEIALRLADGLLLCNQLLVDLNHQIGVIDSCNQKYECKHGRQPTREEDFGGG